eukprot:TRINITY_DN2595_c0_g1_i6.p1 TRINITY_DN2595_c0_g1~~TRINITY_DN2595_c0_g1_i6.p1  ORF type:complete len:289 (-),score=84.11 TRINITY_DN2595_c0_g1_i6:2864-3730(-)
MGIEHFPAVLRELGDGEETEAVEESGEEQPTDRMWRPPFVYFPAEQRKYKRKSGKPARLAPQHIFVFDDLAGSLKDKALSDFMTRNRHYHCKVILSSQYPNNLSIQSRTQLDYWILFKGHSADKLREIYERADLSVTYEEFERLYQEATTEEPGDKYPFLYVDVRGGTFRRNMVRGKYSKLATPPPYIQSQGGFLPAIPAAVIAAATTAYKVGQAVKPVTRLKQVIGEDNRRKMEGTWYGRVGNAALDLGQSLGFGYAAPMAGVVVAAKKGGVAKKKGGVVAKKKRKY